MLGGIDKMLEARDPTAFVEGPQVNLEVLHAFTRRLVRGVDFGQRCDLLPAGQQRVHLKIVKLKCDTFETKSRVTGLALADAVDKLIADLDAAPR